MPKTDWRQAWIWPRDPSLVRSVDRLGRVGVRGAAGLWHEGGADDVRRSLFPSKLPGLFLLCCGLAACSNFVTYPGQELAESEVATFNCYSRNYLLYMESCRFGAVDGVRPELSQLFSNTSKILPGPHWIEVAFEKYFGGGGGVTDVCAFDLDMRAGHRYQVKAHSLATDISHFAKHDGQRGLYGGSIEVLITTPSGLEESRQIGATCNFGGGSLCRKDQDCVPHPDIRCFPQENFPFGLCRFKD